ncbi:MAG: 2-oxoadipate dioxygenase/decarboxylase family protein [Panacagrimonas sp.]
MRLTPAGIRARFVDAATAKFAGQVPDFVTLRKLVTGRGGGFHNDHGAIRTADPAVCARIERAANVMGLRREREYEFPAKKLRSFDLQVIGEDADEFKLFVSQIDLAAYPAAIAELIRQDTEEQAAAGDHAPLDALIAQAARDGGLDSVQADRFIDLLLHGLMTRAGPPLWRSTLDAVATISGEAASALALGADFNHITLDVHAAGFGDIEAMVTVMLERGFSMLSEIQGGPGTPLRQTATLAVPQATAVREADRQFGIAMTERQFVEIIERNQAINRFGDAQWRDDGRPLIFRHFLAANAERIFEAASSRPGRS